MPSQIIFTGKRFNHYNGEMTDVTYNASLQNDGNAYFNDDFMYRCRPDGSNLQLFYIEKQIWINTANIQDLTPYGFNPLDFISNILSGGVNANATGAANSDMVENAVQWAIKKCSAKNVTYSQTYRNLNNPNGYSYDCSSFVITAFNQAGFNINATYTGDMRSGFTAEGFIWIPGSEWESNQLIRGDVLLDEVNHTQMYIGNNEDANCGDTPARIVPHSVNNYGRYWDGILRYNSLNI